MKHTQLVFFVVLSVLIVPQITLAPDQGTATLTRIESGAIKSDDFTSLDTGFWDSSGTVSGGLITLTSSGTPQTLVSKARYGEYTTVEIRAKFASGIPVENSTRFGFLDVGKTRRDSSDNRSAFRGSANKVESYGSIDSPSPGQVTAGTQTDNNGEYHRYKIFLGKDNMQSWVDGGTAATVSVKFANQQYVGAISANETQGTTNQLIIDKISIYKNSTIRIQGLLPTQKVELLDGENVVRATTTVQANSKEATIDLATLTAPRDATDVAMPISNGKFRISSASGKQNITLSVADPIFGGDVYKVSGMAKYTIQLKKGSGTFGFNLISSPILEPVYIDEIETACGAALSAIGPRNAKFKTWAWANDGWIHPNPLAPGQAVWITTTKDCSLDVIGSAFNGAVTLQQGSGFFRGFNLIGTHGDLDRIKGDCDFKGIGPAAAPRTVWAWDASRQDWYNPTTHLDPTQGLWVRMNDTPSGSCSFSNSCRITEGSVCPSGQTECTDMTVTPSTGRVWCR
ncbi:MAG: hypothetical protein HY366_01680 [Candidatus Aenigmarchaeota archaeon]|nr:hypothetical protein [Candidatus Aenigmarchaeota archaeon]